MASQQNELKRFTQKPNYIKYDKRLDTIGAHLLLEYVLEKRTIEGWIFRRKAILDELHLTESSYKRARTLLIECGYLIDRSEHKKRSVAFDFNTHCLHEKPRGRVTDEPNKGSNEQKEGFTYEPLNNTESNNTETKTESYLDNKNNNSSDSWLDQITDSVTDDTADGANEVNQPVGGEVDWLEARPELRSEGLLTEDWMKRTDMTPDEQKRYKEIVEKHTH